MTSEEIVISYIASWSAADTAERDRLLERCWTDDGVYQDPLSEAAGRPALSRLIGGFQSQRPGFRFELTSGIDEHHLVLRFSWAVVGPNGEKVMEGLDIGELAPDGRLGRITGFFGPFPAADSGAH
jgi:hypothetical protein